MKIRKMEIVYHPGGDAFPGDPLNPEGVRDLRKPTVALKVTIEDTDGEVFQFGDYKELRSIGPADVLMAVSDLARELSQYGGRPVPTVSTAPGSAFSTREPARYTAVHVITPAQRDAAARHIHRARKLLSAKAKEGNFNWAQTASGMTVIALERLLGLVGGDNPGASEEGDA